MNEESTKKESFDEVLSSILAEKVEVPIDLLPRVMLAISRRQQLYARWKAAGFLISSLGSLTVVFLAAKEAIWQINQSGLLNILSLLFSDLTVVLLNWQSFILSCLEALPVFPIILTSGALFILLFSLKFVTQNVLRLKVNFYPKLRIN